MRDWLKWLGLNQQPSRYQQDALPIELHFSRYPAKNAEQESEGVSDVGAVSIHASLRC
jgi:hypothetical protein